MSKEEVKTERHTETKEEAIKNMRKIVEVEEENHVETKMKLCAVNCAKYVIN